MIGGFLGGHFGGKNNIGYFLNNVRYFSKNVRHCFYDMPYAILRIIFHRIILPL